MKDRIYVEGLLLRTTLGVDHEQRSQRQDVRISLRLGTQNDWPAISDNLEDAVDYRTISKRVIRLVERSRFYLMERLATEIATICLDDHRVERVRVRIEKLAALRAARYVAVEIERTRDDLVPTTHRCFITLRSQVKSQGHLREVVERLHGSMSVLALSPIYRRTIVRAHRRVSCLHGAALVETPMTPAQLKYRLTAIENALKNSQSDEQEDLISLTIALYDKAVFELAGQQIPHPGVLKQAHVAIPLADLAPAYHHPKTNQPLADIADGLSVTDITKTDITL